MTTKKKKELDDKLKKLGISSKNISRARAPKTTAVLNKLKRKRK